MNPSLQILDKKDQNFPSSNAGKRTVEWAKNNTPKIDNRKIKNREDIWRAYIARIESIFIKNSKDENRTHNNTPANNEGKVEGRKETKAERALRFMKYKIQKENTIDLENSDEVNKIATGLYESEKKIAIERGMGGDIENLDSGEVINRYIESIKEKKNIQSESLSAWINYISGPDCTLPTWFKYHAVRSLLAMGTKNIDKGDYNKRAATTVSPYPEFNSESLGWVFNALIKELKINEVTSQVVKQKQEALGDGAELTETDKEKEAERVESIMSSDRFSKLFYFASHEVKGNLDRSYIEGEWVKYGEGSDYTLLEKALKGKGTGWCTAVGSAKEQIESGDFYVYYSKNGKTGKYTEPRIAVRMIRNSEISEVRGVNPGQELEPQFADIIDTKMGDFGEGEAKQYKKKSSDMKTLTQICKKDEMGTELTKEELRFIYEFDEKIQSFGYQKDPRISIMKNRLLTKIKPLTEYQDCPEWVEDSLKVDYICKKDEMGMELIKEELRFIYEVDNKIEGFGYKDDPRIKKFKENRKENKLQDYILIFNINEEKEIQELKRKLSIDGLSLRNLNQVLEVKNINPKEILKEKSSSNIKVGIYHRNGFKEKILPLIKEDSIPSSVNYTTYSLDKDMTGQDILKHLNINEGQIFTIEEFAQFISNQSEIIRDTLTKTSPLLLNTYNLLPVKQVDGSLLLVSLDWGSGNPRWYFHANDLSNQWRTGIQVLVRN